jgi:hypothetical protein
MDPRDVREALIEEITDGLTVFAAGYPIAKLSRTLEELSSCFQALAICHMLESADVAQYRDNLARSAFARRYFLTRTAADSTDRRLALSRTEAFFDALAAGHGLLAREIAQLSTSPWREAWEYKDDYYYFLFLHSIVMQPGSLAQPESLRLLNQFEAALEGEPSPRLDVLRSLAAGDQAGFHSGLLAMMAEHEMHMQAAKERLLDPDLQTLLFWPRTFLSIEGLALIAIATAMRMTVAEDIPFCPMVARLGMSQPATEDPFLHIEALVRSGT